MSKKDSGQKEKMAINKLEEALLRCDAIEPYLSQNDKTPSFDGYLFVYKGKKTKDNLLGRINVQVKGTETKIVEQSYKYQTEVSDLNNYRNDNGCVFFLVSLDFDNNTCKIFYNCLQILDLNRILEKAKGQKSININLNEFPKDNPVEIKYSNLETIAIDEFGVKVAEGENMLVLISSETCSFSITAEPVYNKVLLSEKKKEQTQMLPLKVLAKPTFSV